MSVRPATVKRNGSAASSVGTRSTLCSASSMVPLHCTKIGLFGPAIESAAVVGQSQCAVVS